MKWCLPAFASMQSRFCDTDVPPESNANFAFILTGLDQITTKAVFLLPNSVLTTDNVAEANVRKWLVEKNFIEAIISCPRDMFESTDISTCIIVLNKQKATTDIMFVDMRKTCGVEERKQNGQIGGNSHEKRTYTKTFNIFRDEDMQKAISAIADKVDINSFSRRVSPDIVAENTFMLLPSRYIEFESETVKHREYSDIISDINRIVAEKNAVKLTVNETLARQLGLTELYEEKKAATQNNANLNGVLSFSGASLIDEDYIALSKNKNEFTFSNKSKDFISSIFMIIFQTWKQHIYYLNNEENRYLIELRDAMLPDLISGKIDLSENDIPT
jgi:hypothetical protein